MLVADPETVLAILLLAVAVSVWLGRLPYLRSLGGALLAILFGAVLANLGIIPTHDEMPRLYDPIFQQVTLAAIFLILLEVNLSAIKRAGAPMLLAFALGALGTMLGVLAASALMPGARAMLGEHFAGAGAMLTGTYIGGSANFNLLAIEYGVTKNPALFTAMVVVDNVMSAAWILATIAIPPLLAKSRRFPPKAFAAEAADPPPPPLEGISAVAVPIAAAAVALVLSRGIANMSGGVVPVILVLTTVALLAAQIPAVTRLSLSRPLGLFGLYLFLAAVGASADLKALLTYGALGAVLFGFIAIIFAVHALVLFSAGAILRFDPDLVAIASSANIGGATTAVALAEVRGREDLLLPGLLAGTLGTASGTYAGFAIGSALGALFV
jgi:uncharacterized membrane protein